MHLHIDFVLLYHWLLGQIFSPSCSLVIKFTWQKHTSLHFALQTAENLEIIRIFRIAIVCLLLFNFKVETPRHLQVHFEVAKQINNWDYFVSFSSPVEHLALDMWQEQSLVALCKSQSKLAIWVWQIRHWALLKHFQSTLRLPSAMVFL